MLIVIVSIGSDDPFQLMLVKYEEMVKALSPHRTDKSFTMSIGFWCLEWRFQLFNARIFGHSRELPPKICCHYLESDISAVCPKVSLPVIVERSRRQ